PGRRVEQIEPIVVIDEVTEREGGPSPDAKVAAGVDPLMLPGGCEALDRRPIGRQALLHRRGQVGRAVVRERVIVASDRDASSEHCRGWRIGPRQRGGPYDATIAARRVMRVMSVLEPRARPRT